LLSLWHIYDFVQKLFWWYGERHFIWGQIFRHLMNPKIQFDSHSKDFHDFCEKNVPKSPDFEKRISEIFIFKQ
jgi:hypothetical protein